MVARNILGSQLRARCPDDLHCANDRWKNRVDRINIVNEQ